MLTMKNIFFIYYYTDTNLETESVKILVDVCDTIM